MSEKNDKNYYLSKNLRIYKYTNLCEPFIGENNKYHYLYKIIHNPTGKYYIGIHSTENLLDGYSGSGKILQNYIKKYGPYEFDKYILKYYATRDELIKSETEYVTVKEVSDPLCYNLVCGGNSYNGYQKGKQEKGTFYVYNYQINKRTRIRENQLDEFINNGWVKGYGPSNNQGNAARKKVMNFEGQNKNVPIQDIEYFLSLGWKMGRCNHINQDKIYIHKDRIDRGWPDRKLIFPKDLNKWIKKGWVEGYGEASDILKKGTITGRIYVTKNNKTKTINPTELEKYLNNGWEKGVVGFEHHRALVGRKRMYDPNTNESKIVLGNEWESYLENGWLFGMGCRKSPKYKSCFVFKDDKFMKINVDLLDSYLENGWVKRHPASGATQIYKDGKNKMISIDKPELLQQYLDKGWELGAKKKNKL